MQRGQLITIEGIEGAGKSTVVSHVAALLEHAGISCLTTREPGGTPIAEAIRRCLLQTYDEPMMPETELMLMFAGRVQHVAQVIEPALAQGRWVVSDRFVDASYAYQGGGRQMTREKIDALCDWAMPTLRPDMTILLDLPVSTGLSRLIARSGKDRIEQESVEFFERIRAEYLSRAKADPDRFVVVAADQALEQVQAAITQSLQSRIDAYDNVP